MKLKDYLQGRMPKEKDLTAPMSSERADAYDRGYNAAILELGEIEIDLPQTPIKKWGDYCGESGKLPQTRLDESLLDSKEFYDLMQIYRHMPVEKQDAVCKAYDDVKKYIQRFFKPVKEELDEKNIIASINELSWEYDENPEAKGLTRNEFVGKKLYQRLSLPPKPEVPSLGEMLDAHRIKNFPACNKDKFLPTPEEIRIAAAIRDMLVSRKP